MCGIFAVSQAQDSAGKVVLEGLKKLEYRGYDSWGIAVRQGQNVAVQKDTGKISDVQTTFAPGLEAIGHTRWATHGGVTQANAHPHQATGVAVVHNGIFENYAEHKLRFVAQGKTFKSETDTEVIAFLLAELRAEGLDPLAALQKAAQQIQGRFSLLVMWDDVPGIYAARRGSPLILGRTADKTFVASDIPAFLSETQTVNYLDDNEMVVVEGAKTQFYDLNSGEKISKRDIEVPWKAETADKGNFEHFMIKEIFDQKETIASAINHDDETLQEFIRVLHECNGAYLIACGTAHKVCMAGEYFFAQIAGRKVNVLPASEMPYFEQFVHDKTAIIVVSQSGETADIMEVLERSQRKGAKILSLTNVESSSVARLSDVHISINAGVEKAVASTKATTAQMALLFLLAHADKYLITEGRDILRNAASSINDLLNPRYADFVASVSAKYLRSENLFIIGRGSLYPIALEAAIKIQEVSYIHAQGFAAGELKHGPLALIEKDTPCLVLGDDLETISNAVELKSRGAKLIGISSKKIDVFDDWIKVPDTGATQALTTLVPVQILAYHLATGKNLDPDMPRNLAKSVTVK